MFVNFNKEKSLADQADFADLFQKICLIGQISK